MSAARLALLGRPALAPARPSYSRQSAAITKTEYGHDGAWPSS